MAARSCGFDSRPRHIMAKSKLPLKEFGWTSQLAYAVGLLVTDGCLSNDGRHITMRSSETEQLQNFKKCLKLNNKIGFTDRRGGLRVQFGDIQFYNWLIKIGLSPAKSYTIGEIDVPDKFFRDYFRGCLDGDGSICAYQDNYNKYRGRQYSTQRLFIRIVSASRRHIVWLQKKVKCIIGLSGTIIKNQPKDKNRVSIWELKFAKYDSLKIIDWIYYKSNIPCLERKRTIAKNAIITISGQKRKEYTRI